MTRMLTEPVESFRKVFDGELITSAERATYNTVRAVWNTEIDRRPAVIARCSTGRRRRRAGLRPRARHGDHGARRRARHRRARRRDGGLMIDLSA